MGLRNVIGKLKELRRQYDGLRSVRPYLKGPVTYLVHPVDREERSNHMSDKGFVDWNNPDEVHAVFTDIETSDRDSIRRNLKAKKAAAVLAKETNEIRYEQMCVEDEARIRLGNQSGEYFSLDEFRVLFSGWIPTGLSLNGPTSQGRMQQPRSSE